MVPNGITETLIFGAFSMTVKISGSFVSSLLAVDAADMQEAEMRGVDVAFERLHASCSRGG